MMVNFIMAKNKDMAALHIKKGIIFKVFGKMGNKME
jgi:hypothetical protein